MSDRRLPIALRVVEIDETSYWNLEDYPEIAAIKGVFIYDKNLEVHICSFQASREMWAIEGYPLFKGAWEDISPERRDHIYEFVDENWGEQAVDYSDAHDVDSIPTFLDLAWSTTPYEECSYDEQMEAYVDYFRSNSPGPLNGTCEDAESYEAQQAAYERQQDELELTDD